MKLNKLFSPNFSGFILLECIISIFLITLILIPIFSFSSLFIKLKNRGMVSSNLSLNTHIKALLTQGFYNLSTANDGVSLGNFSNIGLEKNSNSDEFIYFKIEDHIYHRDIFYISTQLAQYRDCL